MTREEKARKVAKEIMADVRPQCLAISELLFDRAEDGSFKPEHLKKAHETTQDFDANSEGIWIALLAVRLATIASMCDEDDAFYGESPALIMGQWAGVMFEGEAHQVLEFFQKARFN
jgi:hypothetical protein